MSIVTLKSLEWKEMTTSKGASTTGHELVTVDAEGAEKTSKIFDVALKKRPELKDDLEKLKSVDLPVTVKLEFVKDGAFTVLNRVTESTEEVKKTAAKVFKKKSYGDGTVSDIDRQKSIERQSAINAASEIVSRNLHIDRPIDPEKVGIIVKNLAKELLKFHDEV